MLLAKHTPGKTLTAAEHRQRRLAAQARWAALGATTGAAAGALAGAKRVVSAIPAMSVAAIRASDQAVAVSSERRRTAIIAAIQQRSHSTAAPGSSVLVVGSAVPSRNHLIYDYEIGRLRRQIKRTAPSAQAALQQQITRLEGMKNQRPFFIGRAGSERYPTRTQALKRLIELDAANEAMRLHGLEPDLEAQADEREFLENQVAAPPTKTGAHVERRFRGGETTPAIEARIAAAKKQLRARQRVLLALLDRRTAAVRETARDKVIGELTAALPSRILRAGGKGALLGAGIGLTAAGIGILAHHVALHGSRNSKTVSKISDSRLILEKAARNSPEDQIGTGLGLTFRQWIDRLLGKNEEPVNLGDGIAAGAGPGIIQAFAEGARDLPIDREQSDPKSWLEVDFDSLNPAVRRHMADYALDRIVEISTAQRDAIRAALMQGPVLRGIGPLEVARVIRQAIGLTAYQQSVVEGFRAGLQALDPRVLDRKLRDRRYDSVLSRAIETGVPLTAHQISAMTDAYHRRMVALRARMIARTEALRATSYGGLARAQEVLDDNPELEVIKKWLATKDERTRDTHRDLDGREVEGMGTAFVTTKGNPIRWPLDDKAAADEVINCRCTLQFIFRPKRGVFQAVAA